MLTALAAVDLVLGVWLLRDALARTASPGRRAVVGAALVVMALGLVWLSGSSVREPGPVPAPPAGTLV